VNIPRPRATAIAAATITLVAGTATAATGAAGKPTGSERLQDKVKVSQIMTHLEALQKVADEYGSRASGTPGYEASARYVEHRLRTAGYTTARQYFPFTYTEILAEKVHENTPTARDLDNHVMTASPSTPKGGITEDLVSPPTITGCTGEWGDVSAVGRIALVQRGGCPFLEKSQQAAAAGASAVIVFNNADGELNGTLGNEPSGAVPTTGITQADGQALRTEMATGPVNMTLDLRTLVEQRQTFNVTAELKGTSPDDVVMLGGHLDSVVGGPGINDNGSGSATILTVAQQMAKMPAPRNTIRFAWWGAEEEGLVGSTYYVNQLKQQSPDELNRIATYLNFDMIGSPNYIVAVYDADQSTYKAPEGVAIPPGSEATEDVFTDYFDGIGQKWVDYAYSGRSDYQAFINNGIAAGGLSSGSDGVKTPEQQAMFGGTAGDIYDPNYHTPADDLSNVNLRVLDVMSDAIANAAYSLGQDVSAIRG
jgi:Zn-dependent M28 family amino/carboxypeptidase